MRPQRPAASSNNLTRAGESGDTLPPLRSDKTMRQQGPAAAVTRTTMSGSAKRRRAPPPPPAPPRPLLQRPKLTRSQHLHSLKVFLGWLALGAASSWFFWAPLQRLGRIARQQVHVTSRGPIGGVEVVESALEKQVDASAAFEVLARGYQWAEGPVFGRFRNGSIYVLTSDVKNNTAYIVRGGGASRPTLQLTGRPLSDTVDRGRRKRAIPPQERVRWI